jgi:oligopeptide/dipeptide ABC transporter ATP-binding protein
MMSSNDVLRTEDLSKRFTQRSALNPLRQTVIPAVDHVSLSVGRAETLAVVGESGSGKSTLGRLILHLHKADAGRMWLLGRPVEGLSDAAFRPLRRHVQIVFQNPLASFDPRYTIGSSIAEVLRFAGDNARRDVGDLLREVGLSPRFAGLPPRLVSGGELQRAAVARAIATYPELVVLDEPTSALDMSIQGQVLSLLRRLQESHGISYLLATHDLRVVRMVAHRVCVMYLGQVVESATVDELFSKPMHPYTLGLLRAEQLTHGRGPTEGGLRIRGSLRYPDPGYEGCRLVSRCPLATEACRQRQDLVEARPDHLVRCWRAAAGETLELGKLN